MLRGVERSVFLSSRLFLLWVLLLFFLCLVPLSFAYPGGVSGTLELWLDASNTTTLFESSCGGTAASDGGTVGCWEDLSGNNNDVIASGSLRPLLRSSGGRLVNFNPTIDFDGTDDFLEDADGENYINGMSEFSTFVVVDSDQIGYDAYIFNSENSGSLDEAPWGLRFDDVGFDTGRDDTFKTGISNGTVELYEANEANIHTARPMLLGLHWESDQIPSLFISSRSVSMEVDQTISGVIAGADYVRIGDDGNQDFWNGGISEIIHYTSNVSGASRLRIESYLAMKYGITLDSSVDYVDSGGGVVYATTSSHNSYSHDVAGIIVDVASGLNQTQSLSTESDGIVTMSDPTSLDDGDSLLWGNDNGALTEINTNIPKEAATRLTRVWRVDLGGDVGTVTVAFNVTDLSVTGVNAEDFTLVVDSSDTDFTTGVTRYSATSYSENVATFNSVSFSGDDYFMLVTSDDAVNPNVTDLVPSQGSVFNVSNTIEVAATVMDALSNVSVVVADLEFPNGSVTSLVLSDADGDSGSKYNSSFTLPVLAGNYTLLIRANDTRDNLNDTESITFLVDLSDPLDISGALGWYDGADSTSLFTDSSCSTQVSSDNDLVECWMNKGTGNNATVNSGSNPARYRSLSTELIGASTTLRFLKNISTVYETGIDIRATTNEDVTIFSVYRPRTTNNSDTGQGLWGNDDGSWDRFFYSFFQASVPLGTDGVDDGLISLGGSSQGLSIDGSGIVDEVFLLTTVYDGNISGGTNSGPANGSQVYFDGDPKERFTDESHATAAQTQMFLGWDGDNGAYDGDLSEIIVYDTALNLCQIELVNNYLGPKYGKDFSGISDNYGYSSPHDNDVNGVKEYAGNCSINVEVTSARSSIATVFNPSTLDLDDALTFAHNDAGFSIVTDAPSTYPNRIDQSWRVDVDNSPGTVSVSFDLAAAGLGTAGRTFALLIDSDTTFSDASTHTTGYSISGTTVTFTSVSFSDGQYFTLAFEQSNPTISFVDPTLANDTYHPYDQFVVNITSSFDGDHYTFVDLDSSLVLWMRFDDVDGGGDPGDISGYFNNGTLNSGALINSSGRFGDALQLDGSNDYVEIPDDPTLNFDDRDFSFFAWFNSHVVPSTTRQILGKRASGSGNYEVQVESGGLIRTYYGDSGSSGSMYASTTVAANTWYHIGVIKGNGSLSIYVNGVFENKTDSTHDVDSSSNLFIGRDAPSNSENFQGVIDEVIIFNRSLSATEVSALYNASATQYVNNFSNLTDGNYTFIGYAVGTNGLRNQTELREVTVDTTSVDLSINSSHIFPETLTPVENQTIYINATISNLWSADATNVTVRVMDDDVELTTLYANISGFSSTNITLDWEATLGINEIRIEIDPFSEEQDLNFSNNNASKNLTVGLYHLFYGTADGDFVLGIGDNTVFNYPQSEVQHVLAMDADSSVDFSNVWPLGRNTSLLPSENDFSEADTLLGLTGRNESVQSVFASDASTPLYTTELDIRDRILTNVPIVNSTNSSDFVTGILWDGSDDSTDEFDSSEAEDLIFVGKVSTQTVGTYGTYDYEIKVPASLRNYKGGSPLITFYLDLG